MTAMLDRTLLLIAPEAYTRHKGSLTPEEVEQVQEALAVRYLRTHPAPQPVPVWPRRPRWPYRHGRSA